MRWVVFVFCIPALSGCSPQKASSPNADPNAARPSQVDAARPSGQNALRSSRLAWVQQARQIKLRDARAQIRARDYARQTPGAIPSSLPESLRRLIPSDIESKVIGFEVHRGMKLVRSSPKRLFLRLRLLTLERGEPLRRAVKANLVAGGWAPKDAQLSSPQHVPKMGTLSWTIVEPEERPTTIDLKIEADISQHSAPSVDTLMRVLPPWWPVVSKSSVGGFEYSWFHGIHLGGVFSDIERVSILYNPTDTKRLDQDLYRAVGAAGYRADRDHRENAWARP